MIPQGGMALALVRERWTERIAKHLQEPGTLRLLLVVHRFPPHSLAGTEIYTYALAQELRQRGHKIRVVYPEHDAARPQGALVDDVYEGLPVTRLNIHPSEDFENQFNNKKVATAFGRYLECVEVDLVHIHHLIGFSASIVSVLSRQSIPTVMTAHDGWLICQQVHFIRPGAAGGFCRKGPETLEKCAHCLIARYPGLRLSEHFSKLLDGLAMRRNYLQKALTLVDTLFVPSGFIRRALADHGFVHPRVVISPLGLRLFTPSSREQHRDQLRFVFLGNIFLTKGLDILIRAFNLVDPKKACLDIYGGIIDRHYFRRVVDRISPEHTVRYHGAYTHTDLPEIFARADVAVIPSRAESFSIVARECLHGSVPVIASNVGGMPEIIRDGENGLLFRPGDHEDLAKKLSFFVEDPERVEALRSRILPVRSIADDADQLEPVYRRTVVAKSQEKSSIPSTHECVGAG
jgi:glycosyltransferase involved in cell wall biosynthesis